MSRQLPAHPNLEHLKNQAKDRLDDLRGRNPSAKLADAQHAIAREYGFVNWAALKAHVEAAPARSPFEGSWNVDLERSSRHPHNAVQSATLRFTVNGDTVELGHDGVDPSGRQERSHNTLRVDGVEREAAPGLMMTTRWLGPRAFETIAKREGRVIGHGTYEVSSDGKTLTVSSRYAKSNADGWQSDADQVIVLTRA